MRKSKSSRWICWQYFDQEHPELGQAIEEKKVLDDELTEQIIEVAKKFKENR